MICTEALANLAHTLENRKSLLSDKHASIYKPDRNRAVPVQPYVRTIRHVVQTDKRLFKKEMGSTVYHYVLTKKINAAKMLLHDTSMTVSEIAYQVGYADRDNPHRIPGEKRSSKNK
ncbi:MAG: Helix-turn-helix domain [Paenibacillus sp.]|jgi:methylphosphotriester-DNA--protein-cysteine methyltransferase|nr:Helix-turn-helix domain [Paenibacillus sp.]